jgi:hypothetical protein
MYFGISFEPGYVLKKKKQANSYYRFLQVKMVKIAISFGGTNCL